MSINHSPLVSTIIIFLNAEKFIPEAIESVFAQTYQNWELLLIDDGSTDGSTSIGLEYAHQHPEKVRYFEHDNHQNKGMSASRNLGIDHAEGKYIAFLDADDVWLPHKLEQQVAIMETHPEAAMAYGHVQFWYGWTGKPEDVRQDRFLELGVLPNTLVQPPKLLINTLNTSYQEPTPSNAIIRSEAFEKFGRFEDSFRGWGEDKVFFAKVQLNAPVFVSGECWLKYRQHPESCCHRVNKDRRLILAGFQSFLRWLQEYLLSQGMKNTEVWQVLQTTKSKFCYRHSVLYGFCIDFLDSSMVQGRRILPANFRYWLWVNIGSKIYG